ncbi:MAG: tRNA-dihydrouridine synthase family protein, partial [Lachnospiraceae bacterium]|nr:tRNA-dihydrouridine synthase family protein [Lachnospiraceae bacterium]
MMYYLAPMEGITTYIYRNAHARYFGGIDKYFTPFISDKNLAANKNSVSDKSMNSREIRDILPDHNAGIPLVPQVLTNHADRFLAVASKIASYGYDTVNLNLGCPSGTVTAKKRGSGFLSVPDELDAFLYEIYEKCPLKISIKTRLGVSDLSEWDRLLNIYAKYPIHELIIHTRLQQEFYTG